MARGHCKQCYYYNNCVSSMPQSHPLGIWNTIQERREWMQRHMMDCFKSPEQYKRDIESAKNGGNHVEKSNV